jgi:hypothetical protein
VPIFDVKKGNFDLGRVWISFVAAPVKPTFTNPKHS